VVTQCTRARGNSNEDSEEKRIRARENKGQEMLLSSRVAGTKLCFCRRWITNVMNCEPLNVQNTTKYDYSRSTEENHVSKNLVFVGRFSSLRSSLDNNYHGSYSPARQLLQDEILDNFLDSDDSLPNSAPQSQWLILTAGAMGAGKSRCVRFENHAITTIVHRNLYKKSSSSFPQNSFQSFLLRHFLCFRWLQQRDLIPPNLVEVDPDKLRYLLPEHRGFHLVCLIPSPLLTLILIFLCLKSI